MQIRAEHATQSGLEYTVHHPPGDSAGLVLYLPGMATDRYGGFGDDMPSPAVQSALIDVVGDTHTLAFPDLHHMSRLGSTEDIEGVPVEQLRDRAADVLADITNKSDVKGLVLVSECLGSLVTAGLAHQPGVQGADAILWSPIADEGEHNRLAWCDAFGVTQMDEHGNGFLPVSKGARNVSVEADFWHSMDRNSLRNRYQDMKHAFGRVTVFYPTGDPIFPGNKEYLETHTPGFELMPITGNKHRLAKAPMLPALVSGMSELMGVTYGRS